MGKENQKLERVEDDPNYIAYKKALDEGQFDHLPDDHYLAFNEGKFIIDAPTRKELFGKFGKIEEGYPHGSMITEVRPEPITLDGFFTDPDGNLRRGVPTWAHDEEGNKIPVNLEWGSNKVFPREEISPNSKE